MAHPDTATHFRRAVGFGRNNLDAYNALEDSRAILPAHPLRLGFATAAVRGQCLDAPERVLGL